MMFDLTRPFKEWSFNELVQYNQAKILLSIPTGKFNDAVIEACDLTLQWKAQQKPK